MKRKLTSVPRRLGALLNVLALAALVACGGGRSDAPSGTAASATTTAAADATGASALDEAATRSPRRQALAAPTRLAVPVVADADPMLDGLVIPADAPTKGMWSAVQDWPMNAIHLALGPDGKVLSYGAHLGRPDTAFGQTFAWWTPSLGFGPAAHRTFRQDTLPDSFCSSAAWLPDGRLLRTGGGSPLQTTAVDMRTQTPLEIFSPLGNDRWYATTVTLADGRVVVLGGMDENAEQILRDTPDLAIANGIVSMTPEIFSVASGWRTLTGATSRPAFGPDQRRANYPRAWVAPGGDVFGISVDTMWSLKVDAAGGAGETRVLGSFKGPISATAPMNVGAVSTAVMYAPGRILQAGGNGGSGGEGTPGSRAATTVDINGAAPVVTETAAMANVRRQANSAVLPNGQVVVTGGSRYGNRVGTDAVFEAEIWDPVTGLWTVGASAAIERVYHSTTLLLPNGTLLSAGGGAPGPVSNQNAEIYYPPYLFQTVGGVAQLAPRPVVTGVNAKAFGHGNALQVELAAGQQAKRLVLVRTGTVTHAFNNNQRFIELPFTQAGDVVQATMPANPNLAPMGVYHVVVLDAAGVPSKSVLVTLGLDGSTPAPTPALTRGQVYALRSVGNPGQVLATDAAGQGVSLPAADASAAPAAAQFTLRDGLADARCVSLESKASPGQWLRHASLRIGVAANDASAGFAAAATFCPESAPGGRGFVLRAKSHPGYVLNQRGSAVWLDVEAPADAFVASSSFDAVVQSAAPVSTPPSVALTSPGPNATVTAGQTVNLSAVATDADGSVVRVAFYDGATLIATDSTAPYTRPWVATAGVHQLTAKATDNSGQVGTSVPVVVTVDGAAPVNSAPTVSLTTPVAGSTVLPGTSVNLTAVAADADGSVARVAFYDGATLIATDSTAPYSRPWIATAGVHQLTARATDNAGAMSTSAPVTVTVGVNAAPTVALNVPLTGPSLLTGIPVVLSATAADADGQVTGVDFFDGAVLLGSAVSAPYQLQWTGRTAGTHVLTARATDNKGAVSTSAPVSVAVVLPPSAVPPPSATVCASELGLCTLPAGATATVYYGANGLFTSRAGIAGALLCSNAAFGDPAVGSPKSCAYTITASVGLGQGLAGRYYATADLSGGDVLRRTEAINFDWRGSPPVTGTEDGAFSARWSGFIQAPAAGSYQLRTLSDDGIRVWVGGTLVIDHWGRHSVATDTSAAFTMLLGQQRDIRIEYQNVFGWATAKLLWLTPGTADFVPVPASRLYAP